MKKIFILLTSAIFILTGCSNEQKPKNKSVSISSDNKKQEGIEDKKDNNTEDKESQEKNKEVKTTQVKHDYAEAEKTAKDSLYGGVDALRAAYLFHTLNYDANRKAIEKYNVNTQNISETKLSFVVDKYNSLSSDLYNEQDVLNDFLRKLKNDEYIYYKEVDNDFDTEAVNVIKEIPDNKNGDKYGVVYFKKDKIFVSLTGGLGGVNPYVLSPQSKWLEDGENLIIPITMYNQQNTLGEIILTINNKDYTGGEQRSYYYVKSPFKY